MSATGIHGAGMEQLGWLQFPMITARRSHVRGTPPPGRIWQAGSEVPILARCLPDSKLESGSFGGWWWQLDRAQAYTIKHSDISLPDSSTPEHARGIGARVQGKKQLA